MKDESRIGCYEHPKTVDFATIQACDFSDRGAFTAYGRFY